jgi:Na+-driven multidrug efflux pump
MIFAAFCVILFQIFATQIAGIFNGHQQTVEMSTDFLRILCLAVPFMIFNLQISFTFQAMGKGKESLILGIFRQGLFAIPTTFIMNHFFGLYGIVSSQLISDAITFVFSTLIYRSVYNKLVKSNISPVAEF